MKTSKCVNCGAVAKPAGCVFVCEYCGTVMQPEPPPAAAGQAAAARQRSSGLSGIFSMLADKTLQIQGEFQRLYLDKVKAGINTAGAGAAAALAPYEPQRDNIYRFKSDPPYIAPAGASNAGAILINGLNKACVFAYPHNDFSVFADGLSRTAYMHKGAKAPQQQFNNYILNIVYQYANVFKSIAAVKPESVSGYTEWKAETSMRAVYYAGSLINLLPPSFIKTNAAGLKREFIPLFKNCAEDASRLAAPGNKHAAERANLDAWIKYLSSI